MIKVTIEQIKESIKQAGEMSLFWTEMAEATLNAIDTCNEEGIYITDFEDDRGNRCGGYRRTLENALSTAIYRGEEKCSLFTEMQERTLVGRLDERGVTVIG